MKSDPVKAHENLNKDLRHQFRFAATFFQSWFLLSIIIGISLVIGLLAADEVDTYPSDWVFLFLLTVCSSLGCALLITGCHYWYEKRGKRVLRKKPLRNLIAAGAEVRGENVVGMHHDYVFNIAWVGYVKRLQMGSFIVHVYYEPTPALNQLRLENQSKVSEWSKIQFNENYLRFYFTKVLFRDGFKTLTNELDRITERLSKRGINPTLKAHTKVQLITPVGFDKIFGDRMSHL